MAKLPMIPEGDFAGWIADPNGHESQWNINDGESVVPSENRHEIDDSSYTAEVIGLVEVPTRINKGKGAMAQYIAVEVGPAIRGLVQH